MPRKRTVLATLLAAASLVGCGDDGAASEEAPEPSATDREYAASATVAAADLEQLSAMPGQSFVTSTLTRPCEKQGIEKGTCQCAADAVLGEVSPVELSLLYLQDEGVRVAGNAVYKALKACDAGQSPGNLGLDQVAGRPVEVTPETVEKLFSDEDRATEVAVNSCVRDSGESEGVCQCIQDSLAADFNPYEAFVLGFAAVEAQEVTPYMRGVIEGCGAEL